MLLNALDMSKRYVFVIHVLKDFICEIKYRHDFVFDGDALLFFLEPGVFQFRFEALEVRQLVVEVGFHLRGDLAGSLREDGYGFEQVARLRHEGVYVDSLDRHVSPG